ncbi:MAG: hypothetical protein ABL996_15235 [Micropepsaceae bacterium]
MTTRTTSAVYVLALAMLLPGCISCADTNSVALGELSASGDMTENADGTASFEFRVENQRADVTVTGFTVTTTFYDRSVSAENVLATYHWSFVSEVAPKGVLLEYGALDANAVAALKQRTADAGGLSKAVCTYRAKVDSHAAAGGE